MSNTTPSVNTITFEDFVRLAPFKWKEGLDSVPQVIRGSGLFKVDPFPNMSGNTREYNELDVEQFSSRKNEGDQAVQSRSQIGFSKILKLERIGTDTGVTWEVRNQGKYPDKLREITSLAEQQARRMELDMTHRITFGTATSYTNKDGESVDTSIGDTLALFSTAHTLRGTSTTFRNRLANNPQLSKGALELIEAQIVSNTLNHFGEKMTAPYDVLFYADDPNTDNTARELMAATAEISAPNEGVPNVYKSKYKLVKLPYLNTDANGSPDTTKNKNWGLAASRISSAYVAVQQEPTMGGGTTATNAEDISTETVVYTGRATYGIVVCGARWIQFSSGDGTA